MKSPEINEDPPPDAANGLDRTVYEELRRIAARAMGSARDRHTLQPTALVHEVYLKLAGHGGWTDRVHFQAVAARAIRQVLINHARAKGRLKRGGDGGRRVMLDTSVLGEFESAAEINEIDDALRVLEREDPRAARVVELRFFGDLSMKEAAAQLDISLRTAERDWRFARAWLHQALRDANDET